MATIRATGGGKFDVLGTHAFPEGGTYRVAIAITDLTDGNTHTIHSGAWVANRMVAVTGRLNPAFDSGPSNADGITNVVQPGLLGTAEPLSTVVFVARRSDQAEETYIGHTTTNVLGGWSFTPFVPLGEGTWTIRAWRSTRRATSAPTRRRSSARGSAR